MRADAVWIGAVEERGVRRDAETGLHGSLASFDSLIVSAVAANREIVMFALAVDVNRERQILTRLEEMQLLFKQKRIRAEIDVFLALDEPFDDLVDLRMHQRFAAGDGNHRRAALIHRLEAFFGRQFFFQNVRWVLNFAAAGARQVAAEKRLEHQHKRIALAACDLLFDQVSGYSPAL